jgi:hypothetical protein
MRTLGEEHQAIKLGVIESTIAIKVELRGKDLSELGLEVVGQSSVGRNESLPPQAKRA